MEFLCASETTMAVVFGLFASVGVLEERGATQPEILRHRHVADFPNACAIEGLT